MWRNVLFGGNVGYRARLGRRKKRRLAATGAAITAITASVITGVPAASARSSETVIVTASGLLSPVTAVLQVGGSVQTQFRLINGVLASIPTAAATVLNALPGIVVTPDAQVSLEDVPESTGPHAPSDAFLDQTGASQLAAQGDTGQGVTVAVVDTGIDQLPDFSGRLIGGVDLTGGGNPFQDDYGHGTFVAGLIAGDGASSNGQYSGEAPGANLVSIKVAGVNGLTDLGTIIQGLQWAVDHQGLYQIKVLNLSLGFQPNESKAKGKGGSYKVFDQAAMGTRSSQRLQIEADLRKGLMREELEVHYQPFFSLGGGRIVGAEALVRWRHPVHGLIDPTKFIPMAEETGLILPLGRYVLERACQQVRSIRDQVGVDLPISINLSPRQFQESGLLSQVAAALDASGLPSELLIFEITETMVMEDLAGAREVMKRLNRLGVRLAIDDFGTGHSSLAYLKQFPVHEVKVDRVFVQGIAESTVDSAIVQAVIDLANAMDIATVAEGVETRDQVAERAGYLVTAGCGATCAA